MVKRVQQNPIPKSFGGQQNNPQAMPYVLDLMRSTSSTLINNGRVIEGDEIPLNTPISCLNPISGRIILTKGIFNGFDDRGNILIQDSDRPIFTFGAGTIVRIIHNTDTRQYTENDKSPTVVIDASNLTLASTTLEEDLDSESLYIVRGSLGKVIGAGKYEGYHFSNNNSVVIWLDSGKLIEASNKGPITLTKLNSPISEIKAVHKPVVKEHDSSIRTKIEQLVERWGGTIFENNTILYGDEINSGTRVTCIDLNTGELVAHGKYEYAKGQHLVSGKRINDSYGLLFRINENIVNWADYIANLDSQGIDFYPFNRTDPMESIKKADKLEDDIGQTLFVVAKASNGSFISIGHYLGYHLTKEGHISLWMSDGKCIEVNTEHLIVANAEKK